MIPSSLLSFIFLASWLFAACSFSENKKTPVKTEPRLIEQEKDYLFFLHNRFLEVKGLDSAHPEYGKVEYKAIIESFEKSGFTVISEKRKSHTDMKDYARKVVGQIDSLLSLGVKPDHITVVGTSKGGYIAQYVSTFLENPEVNYVFIGAYQDLDPEELPEINFCGNILTIYEKTDHYGVSALERKKISKLKISHFKQIELNTSLKHGFLYKALPEWIEPTIAWGKRKYR
jgi:predicted esterase YcpF (UPF0227 family)